MIHWRVLLPAAAVLAMGVADARAQAAAASGAGAQQIYVSAVDRRGNPVPGLTAADFQVREDDASREVLDVKVATEPLHIALLIDDSAAARDATIYLRDALAAFFERMRGHAQIALITTGDRPTVLAPYTSDTDVLNERARRIFPRTNAGAYLLEAVIDASRGLAARDTPRRAIVAVSFEGTEFSPQQYQDVLKELEKSGATLHVLTVGSPSSAPMTDEMRNRGMAIAEGTSRTGGRRDQVIALSGLPDRMKQLADELLNQYVVTYARPEKLIPPQKVSVTSPRRDVTVRARTRVPAR